MRCFDRLFRVCALLTACAFSSMPQTAVAQDMLSNLVGWDTTIAMPSAAMGGERQIRIFTPDRYAAETGEAFGVLYMLDAQSDVLWDMVKGDVAYMVHQRRVLPLMVVGIVSENRGKEFSPKAERSVQLYEHLNTEVIPYVDARFRTNALRILAGHSWGGAFLGHVLFSERRDAFQAYLGISPSLDAFNGMLLLRADSMLAADPLPRIFVAATGTQGIIEFENHRAAHVLDSMVHVHANPAFQWSYRRFEGADHWTCVSPTVTLGLAAISRQFLPDEPMVRQLAGADPTSLRPGLKALAARNLEDYGFAYTAPARHWESIGDNIRELGDPELALELYAFALEQGSDRQGLVYFKRAQVLAEIGDADRYVQGLKDADRALKIHGPSMKPSLYEALRKELDAMLEAKP